MVDTLTIIAHDRFDEVIREARKPDSVIAMKTLTIGEGGDITPEHREVVSVPTAAEAIFTGWQLDLPGDVPGQVAEERTAYVLPTPEQVACADTTMQFIRDKYERALSGGLADLRKPEVQAQIARDVRQATQAAQGSFDAILPAADVEQLVAQIAISIADNSIEIPEIVVLPSREVNFWFDDFDLANLDAIRFQPSSDTILIRNLRTDTQRELARSQDGPRETRVENYIIRHLMDFPEVDYDSQADLLYKLAGQSGLIKPWTSRSGSPSINRRCCSFSPCVGAGGGGRSSPVSVPWSRIAQRLRRSKRA